MSIIMNIKEWIVPIAFAALTTWALNHFVLDHFFGHKDGSNPSGKVSFVAPVEDVERPLKVDIDFLDNEKKLEEKTLEVKTSWVRLTFSNYGAVLSNAKFTHPSSQTIDMVQTIDQPSFESREQACFLVAFNEMTPYYYQLVDQQQDDEKITCVYKNRSSKADIEKTFIIYKDKHQIDLVISCTPRSDAEDSLQLRVIFPSPDMPGVTYDEISSILVNANQKFERTASYSVKQQQGWIRPGLFGADNRYFAHALVHDANRFVERAYYKQFGATQLLSIVESGQVTEPTTWRLGFFMGPKTEEAIVAVDSRLKDALGYAGFLSPIARLLFMLLKYLNELLGNFGLAIIALTILLKLVLAPFTFGGQQRLEKSKEFSKKLTYLKKRYKNDQERLALEQAKLMKEGGFPGLGCLPLLLQIPIFISIRGVIASSFELYGASFLWIPDLSGRDPYYILPMLVVLGMLVQAMYADKTQRMMFFVMAIVLGAVMSNFSAGLALYFFVTNVLTLIQTQVAKRFSNNNGVSVRVR